jgi:drug/metabolite transporter (DMT)-like permease
MAGGCLHTLWYAPPWWAVHLVLFLILSVGVGMGSTVIKIGLTQANPVIFAFARNAIGSVVLGSLAKLMREKMAIQRRHWPVLLAAGFGVFIR